MRITGDEMSAVTVAVQTSQVMRLFGWTFAELGAKQGVDEEICAIDFCDSQKTLQLARQDLAWVEYIYWRRHAAVPG